MNDRYITYITEMLKAVQSTRTIMRIYHFVQRLYKIEETGRKAA